MTTLTAVDPPGCGCTECITGQYVPLDHATPENITALLNGQLRNHTGVELRITAVYALRAEASVGVALTETMRVEHEDLVWHLEPSDAASVTVTAVPDYHDCSSIFHCRACPARRQRAVGP